MKIFALALCVVAAFAYEKEEGVIVGTDGTIDEIINGHEFALVEFYAPWCGHCKSLAPEYAKAAQQLADEESPAVLVKVDATVHEKSAQKYEVQGYPTLKWFVNGKASEYSGGRTASEIVAWINKKSGPPAVEVDSVEKLQKMTKNNDVVVLGSFKKLDSKKAKVFLSAAQGSDVSFAITNNADVAKEYGISSPGVVVIKEFDDGNAIYDGEFDVDALAEFVSAESMPLVIEFTDESANKIFSGDIKQHLLMFVDTSSDDFEDLKAALNAAAKDNKGKLLYIYIDGSKDDNARILDYFGISEGSVPAIRIIDLDKDMAKYKFEGETIDEDSLKSFISDFLAGNLKRHLNAEEVPEDWDSKPVKVVTGLNFDEVVRDESKNAIVFFHAPWCGHCKSLSPTWDLLGEKFEGVDNVVITKVDATANEIEGINIESFPTIKFFPAGSNKMLDYEGGRDIAALVKYINEKSGASIEVTDEDKAASAAEGGDDEEDYDEDYDEDYEEEDYDEEAGEEGEGHDEL